ncbi:MAG: hypothetical protein SGJ21_11205 [Alphaproteobacteria bacterium]|nr:hypothetical protein [Alphaproteobacteria bacterium]
MKWLIRALLVALTPAAPALAQAQAQSEDARLAACIDRIDRDPANAYEDGLAWLGQGNRPAARHCTALALIALGHEDEGAARLEQLANDKDAGSLEARAVYLAQAGNAWLLADAPDAAVLTLTNAMKLRPRDADLRKDRARAYVVLEKWTEAGKDLDASLELSPGDPEALRLRAQALMRMDRLDDAWRDIVQAMRLAPKDVDVLVMRGAIREAMRARGMKDPDGL